MDSKLMEIMKLFSENEQAESLLKQAKTKEEAVALLNELGVSITVEEFVQIGKEIMSDELSEDMLTLVAGGGFWGSVWKGVKDFFHGFLDAF